MLPCNKVVLQLRFIYCDFIATAEGLGRDKIKVATATIITPSDMGTYIFSLMSNENPTETVISDKDRIFAFGAMAPCSNQLRI
ncbi:hypothetical protein MTBPR1_120049 [Candidatus Terasakiella magnetica]|uniref:Uncharacterized protein n=1 Tax=Candidatus Terasakiella magnetica TaxID=1867952 RepID=A0A1C3REN3_9PROT|nr:hypothetical protein MTBPR1_120049 [Candidatus Terasakiella magnetica]